MPYKGSKKQADKGLEEWQAGEEETRKALAKGEGKTFPNVQEAIRWLQSDDAEGGGNGETI